jgi:hypothetical protein
MLSVDNGSRITPKSSWERFTSAPDCHSVGVMAITVAECAGQQLPIQEDGVPFPEHCSIDFSTLNRSTVEKKAKVLVGYAVQRDWLFKDSSQV